MANVYGVANTAWGVLTDVGLGGDVAGPAGTETNVFSTTAHGTDASGFYYPVVWVTMVISLGATPPTALVLGGRIGAGADFDNITVSTLLLVASANLVFATYFTGNPAQAPWQGAGSTVNITVNPTAQAVTVRQLGSRIMFMLARAPDQ